MAKDVALSLFFINGEMIMIKRRKDGLLGLIGGKVEDQESVLNAMEREIEEELETKNFETMYLFTLLTKEIRYNIFIAKSNDTSILDVSNNEVIEVLKISDINHFDGRFIEQEEMLSILAISSVILRIAEASKVMQPLMSKIHGMYDHRPKEALIMLPSRIGHSHQIFRCFYEVNNIGYVILYGEYE